MTKAETRLRLVRAALVVAKPAYRYIALGLALVADAERAHGTIAIVGRNLFYSPAFVARETPAALSAALRHEIEHLARQRHEGTAQP